MATDKKSKDAYQPVLDRLEQQPWSQFGQSASFSATGRPKAKRGMPTGAANLVRDNFTISTWLLMGASLQCGLIACFGAKVWTIGLPVLVLGLRCIQTILQATGVLKNPYIYGVIPGRTTCHFPGKEGAYEGAPSNRPLAVLLISARSNHPMGILGPGSKEAGDFFEDCVKWLEEDADGRGFMSMTRWLNAGDRTTSNELLAIGYFRSVEDIHALAHHAVHRGPWKWWNESEKKLDHVSLTHEIFSCDAGNWETIYLNSKPTHLGTSWVQGKDVRWRSPLIQVSSEHRSSAKRMRRQQTVAEQQCQEETDQFTGEAY